MVIILNGKCLTRNLVSLDETEILRAEAELEAAGWLLLECAQWRDPQTSLKYDTMTAHGILHQRL